MNKEPKYSVKCFIACIILGLFVCCSSHPTQKTTVDDYADKFVIRSKSSHIVYEYWENLLVRSGPKEVFNYFYKLSSSLTKNISKISIQALYENFANFCRAHNLFNEWNTFFQNQQIQMRRG